MNCIFKAWGYVPKQRVCRRCEPLESIFRSLKYDNKRVSQAISLILRTYTVLETDDVLRDEKSRIKRAFAVLVGKFYRLRLPKELRCIAQKADRTIRELEASDTGGQDYVKHMSAIGGEVFQASLGDEKVFSIGATLSGAMVVHDMIRDLHEDRRRNRFNPLNIDPCRKALTEQARMLQVLASNIKMNIQEGPVATMRSPQVGLVSASCPETLNTCFGVCLGVCSALLLYRCCCGQG